MTKTKQHPRTLIVNPHVGGHTAFYLSLIVEAHVGTNPLIYAPLNNPEILNHFERRKLNPADFEWIEPINGRPTEILKHLSEVIPRLQPQQLFFTYLDSFIEPLTSHVFPSPIPDLIGFWFHPYALDSHYRWMPPFDKRTRIRGTVHRSIRRNSLPLHRVFFLDPKAPAMLHRMGYRGASHVMVDPGESRPRNTSSAAREQLGLSGNRKIFLHVGSSERRKGLSLTLDVFLHLAENTQIAEQILLLRVGETRHLSQLDRYKMDELTARGIGHFVNRRVPNEDFEDYFCAADFVLLPYRKFRYSSGILANAIYSKTPVIATAKGLIGATVQQERLGYTLSSLKVSHYAQTVLDALKQPTPAITEESAAKRAPGVFVSDFQRALVSPSLATIRQ